MPDQRDGDAREDWREHPLEHALVAAASYGHLYGPDMSAWPEYTLRQIKGFTDYAALRSAPAMPAAWEAERAAFYTALTHEGAAVVNRVTARILAAGGPAPATGEQEAQRVEDAEWFETAAIGCGGAPHNAALREKAARFYRAAAALRGQVQGDGEEVGG